MIVCYMWQYFIIGIQQSYAIFNYMIENIKPRILFYSSHLFLIPILYYVVIIKPTRLLSNVFSMIFMNFVFSIAFWSNPIKNSNIHYIDAVAAKTSIIVMILVTSIKRVLYQQTMKWFIRSLSIMLLFFYLSNLYSRIEWCCKEHLITHFIGHVMATITMFFIFH